MNRRDTVRFLVALGATAGPFASFAQQARKVWRIGFLVPSMVDMDPGVRDPYAPDVNANKPDPYSSAFLQEMKAAGHRLAADYEIKIRSAAGDYERMPAQARELLKLNVDIIVAVSPLAVGAAYKATKTVPIVCIGAHDPVGFGMAASLGRPGGNLTGLASFYAELIPKHLELLKSILPKASRVAMLTTVNLGVDPKLEQKIRDAALKLGLRLQLLAIDSAEQVPRAFDAMARERADGFIAVADAIFFQERQRLAELALKHYLPSVFATRENVQAGGLVSYGEDFVEQFTQAAKYVSKIMKGAKPGDLPIEQPTKFHLAINVRTARALKLSLPQELLLRADETIE